MNKQSIKKLDLQRETLVPLQANDLGDVNGGTGSVRSIIEASKRICTLTTTVVSQITCKGNQP